MPIYEVFLRQSDLCETSTRTSLGFVEGNLKDLKKIFASGGLTSFELEKVVTEKPEKILLRSQERHDWPPRDGYSGTLKSPYGHMKVGSRFIKNGHEVEKGRLVGVDKPHVVPEHWIDRNG